MPWRVGRIMVAAGALALPLAAAGAARADAPLPVITVEGEASASLVPDIAHLSLGVEAERPTAVAATNAVAAGAQSVLAALRQAGIADDDIATTALALDPVYPEDGGSGSARPPRAFRAGTTFRVTVRPATRAGEIASQLVDKGANTIEGIDYASSEQARRLDDLRADAMRDALHKAQVYTGALGLRLGRVIDITPMGGEVRAPAPAMRTMSIMAAKPVLPAAPGTLSLHTAVTVRWALEP